MFLLRPSSNIFTSTVFSSSFYSFLLPKHCRDQSVLYDMKTTRRLKLQLDQKVKISFYINEIVFKCTKSTLKIVTGRLTFTDLLTNLASRKNIGSNEEELQLRSYEGCVDLQCVLSNKSTSYGFKQNNNYSGSSDHKDIIRHITDLKKPLVFSDLHVSNNCCYLRISLHT